MFQLQGSTFIQRRTLNSFQPRRVSSGRFNRFLRCKVSGSQQYHYTEKSESTTSVFTVHAIQNVPPYSIQSMSTAHISAWKKTQVHAILFSIQIGGIA